MTIICSALKIQPIQYGKWLCFLMPRVARFSMHSWIVQGTLSISAVFYGIVSHDIALYGIALYDIALYGIVLYGIALYGIILYGIALYCTALYFMTVFHIHSFIHSFIQTISIAPLQSPLLLRSSNDTAQILCRSFTMKRHRQLRVRTCPRSLHGG